MDKGEKRGGVHAHSVLEPQGTGGQEEIDIRCARKEGIFIAAVHRRDKRYTEIDGGTHACNGGQYNRRRDAHTHAYM